MLILICTGCNLSNPATATPTDAEDPVATLTPNAPTVDEDCVIRTDWAEYTVQPGDNLTRIAKLTDTTVADLITGNCLENPDRLDRGQVIRVPALPETP